MGDRMTQEEMRGRILAGAIRTEWLDVGVYCECRLCGCNSDSPAINHEPWCPCDPANCVVSREVLQKIEAIARRIVGAEQSADWYSPDCTPQAEEILDMLRAALGEEPTT